MTQNRLNLRNVAAIVACLAVCMMFAGCDRDKESPTPTYTVMFDSKGGSQVTAQTVQEGDTVEKPVDPTLQNYGFAGWAKADNETSALWNFETETVSGDMTLYARWSINTYTVTFDSDGGSAVSAQTIAHGGTATNPAEPTRDGYVFDGWFHGDTEWDFAAAITASVTLKAKWIENTHFTIQDGTVHRGVIPSSASGISIAENININHFALTGGSSFVSMNTEQEISEIYVGVNGVNYYYSVTPQGSLLRSSAPNNYEFIILFNQNLDESFEIQISARLSNGSLTNVCLIPIQYIRAGTGSLQVNLSFDNAKDVDLYVVQPDGEIVFYGNVGNYYEEGGVFKGWGLDIDSNPACNIDGINSENVFFANEYIQSGKYEVWINMWANCNSSIPTNWVVTARYEGSLLSTTYGQNPARGVFPVGTPHNGIGDSLDGAIKVMEFTLSENFLRSMSANRIERTPLTESAKSKLSKTGSIVEE